MPSETLSTIFSAKENVTDALDNISQATAKAKETLESAEESMDDLDESLENATVSSEAFRNAVGRAENATDELGDEAVATAVEIQALNSSFSTLQTPDFDTSGLRRAEADAARARKSIERVATADVGDLRSDFERLAEDIEGVSRIDLDKRLQEPLSDSVRSLEEARDTWDRFDEGIAEGSVYELLDNLREVEQSTKRLEGRDVINADVDLEDLSAELHERLEETEFRPTVTSPFFDENAIDDQLSSIEGELDEFEDQRLLSGEAVEAREIRNRINRVRDTLSDEDISMAARVEGVAGELSELKAEVEAFEQAEEVTIETDVDTATSIEKFHRLANTATRLQDEIGDIEAKIDTASITNAERRVSSIREKLQHTGGSLDNVREAFDEFEDLSDDVDFDVLPADDFDELRESVENISHVSVDPKEVTAEMEEALSRVEREVAIEPHVEGLEEAKARLKAMVAVLEDEDIELDVAVEKARAEMRAAAAAINEIESEIDDIDVDVDIDKSNIERAKEATEEMDDIKKSITFAYDEDTFDRIFENIRSLEEKEIDSDIKKSVRLGYDEEEFSRLFENLQRLRDDTLRTRVEMEYDDDMFQPLESTRKTTVDVDADVDDAWAKLRSISDSDIGKNIDIGYDEATLSRLFNTLRDIDTLEAQARVKVDYDRDSLEALYTRLQEIDAMTATPEIDEDFRNFVNSLDDSVTKRVEFVYDKDSLDISPTVDESSVDEIRNDIIDVNNRLTEGDGTFSERFEGVSDDLTDIHRRVEAIRSSSNVDIISGEDELAEIDARLSNVNDTFDKNINSGAKANSIYADMRRTIAEVSEEDIEIDVDEPDRADRQLSLPVVANTATARAKIEELIQEYSSREIDISVNTEHVEKNADAIRNAINSVDDEEIRFDASSSMFENLLSRGGVEETLEDTFSNVESVDEFKESMTEFNARMGLSEERVKSMRVAMDEVGDDTLRAALAQDSFADSLFVLEKRAGIAKRNIDEVEDAVQSMGISSSASIAPILAMASALDILEEQAEDADDSLELDNIDSLGFGMRSASLNIGALSVGLTQMATTIPAIVTLIGSLAVALGGLAAAALLAGGAIAAIFAGGVLYEAENLAETSEDIEGTMEGVQKIMEGVGELFHQAFAPLKDIGAYDMFRNFVEGAAEALNMLLQGVANMRGELQKLNSAVGDAFWSNFEHLIIEIQETIITFMPTLVALTEWLMQKLPEALNFMQSEGMRFMDSLAEMSAMLVQFFVVLSKFGVTAFNAVFPLLSTIIALFDSFIKVINSLPDSLVENIVSFLAMMVVLRGLISATGKFMATFGSLGDLFTAVAAKGGVFKASIATIGGALAQFLGQGDRYVHWLNNSGEAMLTSASITGILSDAYAGLQGAISKATGFMLAWAAAAKTAYIEGGILAGVTTALTYPFAALWKAVASNIPILNTWAASAQLAYSQGGVLGVVTTGLSGAYARLTAAIYGASTGLVAFLGTLVTVIATEGIAAGATYALTAAVAALSLALDAIGIGLVIKALVVLIAVLGVVAGLMAHNEEIVSALKGVWNGLAGTLITVFNALMEIGVPAFNFFIEVLELFAAVGMAVIDVLTGIFNTIFGAGAAGNLMSALFSGLAEMLSMLVDMIAGFFEFLGDGIQTITEMINEIPGVNVDTDAFEGAKITAEDAQIEQGKMLGGEGKSDGEMSAEEMQKQQTVNNNDITHNNYDLDVDATPGETAHIKRLVKDAIEESSRKERLKQGYSG